VSSGESTRVGVKGHRFYRVATDVLVRHDAVIDKLIGEEVMPFFMRGISGPE
jgi:adenylate cyclase